MGPPLFTCELTNHDNESRQIQTCRGKSTVADLQPQVTETLGVPMQSSYLSRTMKTRFRHFL